MKKQLRKYVNVIHRFLLVLLCCTLIFKYGCVNFVIRLSLMLLPSKLAGISSKLAFVAKPCFINSLWRFVCLRIPMFVFNNWRLWSTLEWSTCLLNLLFEVIQKVRLFRDLVKAGQRSQPLFFFLFHFNL